MTLESDRRQRMKVTFSQVQNQFIDWINEHVRPEMAPEICRADVDDPKRGFTCLLERLVWWYGKVQEASDKRVFFPCFRWCDNRTIDPRGDVISEWRLFSQTFAHLGRGWTCVKCGKGYSVDIEGCSECKSHRDDQLERLDQATWKSDYVDVIATHLKAVDRWWDDLDESLHTG